MKRTLFFVLFLCSSLAYGWSVNGVYTITSVGSHIGDSYITLADSNGNELGHGCYIANRAYTQYGQNDLYETAMTAFLEQKKVKIMCSHVSGELPQAYGGRGIKKYYELDFIFLDQNENYSN